MRSMVMNALLAVTGTGAPKRKPTGGHRAKGYKQTQHDLDRIDAAQDKRIRRGAKMQHDYDRCIANNPCLAN